jgi:hypothetical protein
MEVVANSRVEVAMTKRFALDKTASVTVFTGGT